MKFTICILIVFLMVGCSYYHEDISILETVPYVDYGTQFSPEMMEGQKAFGIGGRYVHTSAEGDTSIDALAPVVTSRSRFGDFVELGFTGSFSPARRHFLPYGLVDLKLGMMKTPVIVAADLGVGFGVGKAGFMSDFRPLIMFGVPIANGVVNPYFAAKVVMLMYPYEKSGTVIETLKWTACTIPGINGGISFSIPTAFKGKKPVKTIKIVPEVNYLFGQEPKAPELEFSVLQVGCNVLWTF